MELSLYNTLTRNVESVLPRDGRQLHFYCCGPTVYGPAHIGNLRTFVLQDLFRRTVEFLGVDTCHVRNVTDVDDKTIRESQQAGLPLDEFTGKWRSKFARDCEALNIIPPHHEPSAVEHIPDQIQLIARLVEKGHAYRAENGSIYFRIESFPDYGKLSGLRQADIRHNASERLVDSDEYGKESSRDFALWKVWKPKDGSNHWDSPWGPGRPGWHIECSAMSMRYLGESFDLHSGGIDLVFPHHENEIAQSESATGQPFARHWFHVAHLRVEGEKMSKSLGNLHVLDDVLGRKFSPAALRYLLLSGHYRQPLNFTWKSLAGAESAWRRILKHLEGIELPPEDEACRSALETAAFEPVLEGLCEDLNTPKALGALNSALKDAAHDGLPQPVLRDMARILDLLGLARTAFPDNNDEPVPPEVEELARRRQEARTAHRWQEADALRDELRERGWEVRDNDTGYELASMIGTK